MPQITPYAGLNLYDIFNVDGNAKVGTALDDNMGTKVSSNMNKIDNYLSQYNVKFGNLESQLSQAYKISVVNLSQASTSETGSFFTGTVSEFTSFKNGLLYIFIFNNSSIGTITFNINAWGDNQLNKIESGTQAQIEANDIKANIPYLVLYLNGAFLLVGENHVQTLENHEQQLIEHEQELGNLTETTENIIDGTITVEKANSANSANTANSANSATTADKAKGLTGQLALAGVETLWSGTANVGDYIAANTSRHNFFLLSAGGWYAIGIKIGNSILFSTNQFVGSHIRAMTVTITINTISTVRYADGHTVAMYFEGGNSADSGGPQLAALYGIGVSGNVL